MQFNTIDKFRGRLLVLSSALMFFYGFILGGLQLVISDIAAEFHTNQTGMGMMVSAQHIAVVAMPLLMGGIADRIGKKPVLTVFTLIFGLGCVLAALSGSLTAYIPSVLLIGSGYSVCESLCSAALSDLGPALGARYINITQCLLAVGAVVSPVVVRALMHGGASWRIAFVICAAAYLLLVPPLAATSFPPPATRPHSPGGKKTSFFTSGVFICLLIAIVLYVGLESGFGYFADTLFAAHLRKEALGAYAISAYWAGMALSRFAFGLRAYRPRPVLIACFALSTVLFILLAASQNAVVSLIVCGLIGAAFGPVWSTLVFLAAQRFPSNSAGAIGMMSSGCGLGGILYPTLMGAISDRFDISTAFGALAVTALADGLLCLLLRPRTLPDPS